jgi:hypothetical protein
LPFFTIFRIAKSIQDAGSFSDNCNTAKQLLRIYALQLYPPCLWPALYGNMLSVYHTFSILCDTTDCRLSDFISTTVSLHLFFEK